AARDQQYACGQSQPVRQTWFRHDDGSGAGIARGRIAASAGRASVGTGDEPQGAHRLGEGEPGSARLRPCGTRHARLSGRRNAQAGHRARSCCRLLQRRRAGGHTPILFTSITTAAGHIKQGTVRALAVTGARRSPALPDVPTLAEAGAPDQESEIFLGILVPGGTPGDVIARLHREIVTIVALPETRDRLLALGFEPIASTPEEFAARIKWEIEKWAKVIRAADIKVQ